MSPYLQDQCFLYCAHRTMRLASNQVKHAWGRYKGTAEPAGNTFNTILTDIAEYVDNQKFYLFRDAHIDEYNHWIAVTNRASGLQGTVTNYLQS